MLQVINSRAVVSSRKVAEVFKKKHKNVLQAIENLECSASFHQANFQPTSETVAMPNGGTRRDPTYNITRDGFTFLAMGFTGKKAMDFKVKYIKVFNEMEARLSNSFAIPQSLSEALRFAADTEEKRLALQAR